MKPYIEERQAKQDLLRNTLAVGEAQLDTGDSTDGELFMQTLIDD